MNPPRPLLLSYNANDPIFFVVDLKNPFFRSYLFFLRFISHPPLTRLPQRQPFAVQVARSPFALLFRQFPLTSMIFLVFGKKVLPCPFFFFLLIGSAMRPLRCFPGVCGDGARSLAKKFLVLPYYGTRVHSPAKRQG